MSNNIKQLRRLMSAANHIRQNSPVILRGAQATPSQALKYAWWFERFRDQLRRNAYRFSYFKIDGSIREARGTLNPALIPAAHMPKASNDQRSTPIDTFAYYDLDAAGWRSFRLDLFIGFVELIPAPDLLQSIDDQDLIDECTERGYTVHGI